MPWSLYALRRAWNRAKSVVAPWWRANSKESYTTGLDGLARALSGFTESRRGRRRGKPVGFPRFKAKHRAVRSCRFTTGVMRLEADRRHVTLPRLGRIRSHESTRKLARRLEAGTARILVRHGGLPGRALVCGVDLPGAAQPTGRRPARADRRGGCGRQRAGGAVHRADGGKPASPQPGVGPAAPAEQAAGPPAGTPQPRRRAPGSRRGGGRKPAQPWRGSTPGWPTPRRDGLHKLTTDAGPPLRHRGGRRPQPGRDAEKPAPVPRDCRPRPGRVRRQLAYKTSWAGGRLVLADRFYPSSKTCSRCQTVKTKLSLGTRIFTCTDCGLVLDRDLNAARNLAALAADRRPELRGDAKRPPRSGKTRHPCRARTDETGTPTHRWGNAASATRQLPNHHPINHPVKDSLMKEERFPCAVVQRPHAARRCRAR